MKYLLAFILTIAQCCVAFAWIAADNPDEMTGKTEYRVYVTSKETINLGWPYGKTKARLYARNHPRFGKDIIFVADSGQIPCHSYSLCKIIVRIDDQTPVTLSGANPSDGSANVVFIQGFDKVTNLLRGGKTAKIEVEFYQNGRQHFTFDITDFSTAMLKPPPKQAR